MKKYKTLTRALDLDSLTVTGIQLRALPELTCFRFCFYDFMIVLDVLDSTFFFLRLCSLFTRLTIAQYENSREWKLHE